MEQRNAAMTVDALVEHTLDPGSIPGRSKQERNGTQCRDSWRTLAPRSTFLHGRAVKGV